MLSLSNSETLDKLTASFEAMLINQLNSRGESIDKNILAVIGPINKTAEDISVQAAEQIRNSAKAIADDGSFKMSYSLSENLNDLATKHLIDTARLRGVSGAYIIWNSRPAGQDHLSDGIRIIDNEIQATYHDNSDIRIKTGPSILAYEQDIKLDQNWTRYYLTDELSGEICRAINFRFAADHLRESVELEESKPSRLQKSSFAFWSEPFGSELTNGKLVYTAPIVDESMRLIGLMGIEIDPKSILSVLPVRDPGYSSSSFLVGIRNSDGSIQLDQMLAKETAAGIFESAASDSGILNLRLLPSKYENLFVAEHTDQQDKSLLDNYLFAVRSLESITPADINDKRQWVILESVDQAEFNNPSKEIKDRLLVVVAAAILLAGVGSFVAGTNLASPLIQLSKQLRKQRVEEEIKLPRFNITELDHLSGSIEQMSRRLKDSAFKTASIIDLLDLPIASFEEQPDNDEVIVSSAMRDLLDLQMDVKLQTSLDMNTWNSLVAHLLSNPELGYDDVYRWQPGENDRVKWLRIKQARHDGRVSGIIVDISEEIIKHRRLVKELDYDDLTKLYTRQAFIHRVEVRLQQASPGQFAVMLFVDLDNLKAINDNYGHQFGDQYLQLAASFMSSFRTIGGIAARFAGDEFAAFVGMKDSYEAAVDECGRIISQLPEQTIKLPDNTMISLKLSIGAAVYPNDAAVAGELLELADFAMYQRKHSGKNGLTWFNKADYDISRRKLEDRADLEELLSEVMIEYAAQPIADTSNGEVIGYDLRLRPTHPHIRHPLDLIRIAAEEGRLSQLEALMMSKAYAWVDDNLNDYSQAKVFVHLFETYSCRFKAVDTMAKDITIDDREQGSWRGSDLAGFDDVYFENLAGRIVFVMDVSGAVPAEIISCCRERCNKYQADLALTGLENFDDNRIIFGDQLPEYIVFDLSLIRDITSDDNRQDLISLMIDHCNHLGISAVASGIASADELITVKQLGFNFAQGYYLGKPQAKASGLDPEALRMLNDV